MKTIFNLSPLKKITPEQNIHQHGNKHKKRSRRPKGRLLYRIGNSNLLGRTAGRRFGYGITHRGVGLDIFHAVIVHYAEIA